MSYPKSLTPCLLLCALLSTPVLAQNAPPSETSATHQDKVLKTLSLIMGEPNYSVDNSYQELEEGFYTKPELVNHNVIFAPITEIVINLGGTAHLDSDMETASYTLLGHTVEVTAGMREAVVDGKTTDLSVVPEWRHGNMWVPVGWTFSQFGAFTRWDKARQRLTAALIMPIGKTTEGQAVGGDYTAKKILRVPAAFWSTPTAVKVADNILGFQNKDGGWPKLETKVDLTVPVNQAGLEGFKIKSTIDNNATYTEIVALAHAFNATHQKRFKTGVEKGIRYLIDAQLSNGGWQQFWPDPLGYKAHITFNDNAIAHTMSILRDAGSLSGDFAFVDKDLSQKAEESFQRGLNLILKTQWVIYGKKTGWAAQYDENTLEPAPGRAFELASVSGDESVGVIRMLMGIQHPSADVINAIQSSVAWFDANKISGLKRARHIDPTLEYGFDFVMEHDPKAPYLWARFYDLKTGQPLFSSRDGMPRQHFEEVAYERRVKYSWYVGTARDLLAKEYPAWAKQHNVPSVLAN